MHACMHGLDEGFINFLKGQIVNMLIFSVYRSRSKVKDIMYILI